jgi:hypothetical protein
MWFFLRNLCGRDITTTLDAGMDGVAVEIVGGVVSGVGAALKPSAKHGFKYSYGS